MWATSVWGTASLWTSVGTLLTRFLRQNKCPPEQVNTRVSRQRQVVLRPPSSFLNRYQGPYPLCEFLSEENYRAVPKGTQYSEGKKEKQTSEQNGPLRKEKKSVWARGVSSSFVGPIISHLQVWWLKGTQFCTRRGGEASQGQEEAGKCYGEAIRLR